jgi:hypothetical protein
MTAASLKESAFFLRRRSVTRFRATRKSHPVVFDRHQQAVRFDQPGEDLLENVFRVGLVGNPPANEVAQAGSFFRDDLGDSKILLGHQCSSAHPSIRVDGRGARIL